jgi:hypothetical protein
MTPTDAERAAAATHRATVKAALDGLGLERFVQIGSFSYGTGVSRFSDVDYLASMIGPRPTSDAALARVRTALRRRFTLTPIEVRRPAVVVRFAAGAETYEVVPAYLRRAQGGDRVYAIPGRQSAWIETAPDAHRNYVGVANLSPAGGAKGLARLLKAWKYLRVVPITSFYLEMRASRYMLNETHVHWPSDMHRILGRLLSNELGAMNDPTGHTGRIYACSSASLQRDALSKLKAAYDRATKARAAEDAGNIREAFGWWDLVFAGMFPAYQ